MRLDDAPAKAAFQGPEPRRLPPPARQGEHGPYSRYDATTRRLVLNRVQPGVDRREQLNQLVAARVGRHRLGGLQLLLELVDARDRSVGLCGGNVELLAAHLRVDTGEHLRLDADELLACQRRLARKSIAGTTRTVIAHLRVVGPFKTRHRGHNG